MSKRVRKYICCFLFLFFLPVLNIRGHLYISREVHNGANLFGDIFMSTDLLPDTGWMNVWGHLP